MRIHEIKNTDMNAYYNVMSQLGDFTDAMSFEAFDRGDAARDSITSIEDFERRREFLRDCFIRAIGGIPDFRIPLNAKITGVIQQGGFRIEKVIYESRPGVYVTANLYVPDGIEKPAAAILFLCGHAKEAKQYRQYQKVCRHLAAAGFVVLAQDPVGQGERLSYYEPSINATTVDWGTVEHDYAGIQCMLLGDSIARYFLHDAMRGIDYLCSRAEVDPARIGVTGNSGGGTQTSLMMICDQRIAAAAPGTFIMNRRSFVKARGVLDAEQIWEGMSALGFDHEDILLAMAPRPVLVLAASYDFFPVEGTMETFRRAKRFWELYGKPENLEIFVDNSPHSYTEDMARRAADFFSRHLLGKPYENRTDMPVLEESLLNCTQSGQVRGDYQKAKFVYEENLDRLKEIEKAKNDLTEEERRDRALKWLSEKVFYNRKPCELNPRFYRTEHAEDMTVQKCFWWSQTGLINHAFLFRSLDLAGKRLPVTVALWDGGTSCIVPHIGWIRETCKTGRAVMVLDVSGVGALQQHSLGNDYESDPFDLYDIYYKIARDLIWLGDSLPALRAYDVTRALDMIGAWEGLDASDISVYACGRYGIYGLMAAAVDNRIKKIAYAGEEVSFRDMVVSRYYNSYDASSIVMPGILEYFDIGDLRKWLNT